LINKPADVVEARLQDVESWARFLTDVERITKVAHERYDFEINSYGHHRVVRVACRKHAKDHSYAWKTIKGPSYNGCLQLRPVDDRRSEVSVWVECWPDGFMSAVNDMMRPRDTGVDRLRLEELLTRPV
jgi:uncharacterized membrane protein